MPPSTIADLQQRLEAGSIGALKGAAADAAAEVRRNIVLELKKQERRRFFPQLLFLLPLLPLLPLLSVTLPPFINFFNRISMLSKMGKSEIRHMIRLEGEQWSRYVKHFFEDSPRRMQNKAIQRLLARGYGHVLFGPQCLLLDVLRTMTYENVTIAHTEVITVPNMVDVMLRVWFCRRTANG